jgi:type IV pilus assembly protein PilM
MTWNPFTVLSGIARASAERPGGGASSRLPLGFVDVRASAAPAADVQAPGRAPIGFVSPPAEPLVFRTELSFRRQPRVMPVVSAGIGSPGENEPPVVGHASSTDDDGAVERDEKVPFYKREIGFRRRSPEPAPPEAQPVWGDEEPFVNHGDTEVSEPARAPEPEDQIEYSAVASVEDEIEAPAADEDEIEVFASHADEDEIEAPAAVTADDEIEPVGARVASPEPEDGLTHSAAEDVDIWGDATPADAIDDEPEHEDLFGDAEGADDTATTAVPVSGGRRSIRLRAGGAKPKRAKSSGRGDRASRRVLGLKIGASQLAAAVVQQVEGRSELVDMARVPLEPGIVVDGDVRDAAALTHALKSFFDEFGLPRKDIRIGLASNRIGVRTFDVTGVDDPERFDNAVRFKAHEVLPVAVHESLLDYRVLDERVNEEGEVLRRVLLVVAPRDQVAPYLDVCSEVGLKVSGVDLEALGLLRAFVEPRSFSSRATDDTATVVVAIGHEASTLLVAGGGACEFTRAFDWGGGTLQEAIAAELDVHAAESATILRHLALTGTAKPLASLDDEARARAVEAVRSKLTPFARELVSSLQFYQTQPESLGIGEIVITGGTSHLIGLAESLHQMIGVNVRVGDPLQRVVVRTGLDPAIEATIGSMAVPIGLAIDDDALRAVNLLPSDLRQAGRKRPNVAAIALPVAAAVPVLALGFLFVQANGAAGDRQSELSAVQAEIAALPKPKKPLVDENVAATEAARAVALASVLGSRVPWDGVLRDVSLVLPKNVSLTKLAAHLPPPPVPGEETASNTAAVGTPAAPAEPTGVEIEGYTSDQPSVALLLSRLRTVPTLTNVQLRSSERELVGQKTIVRFAVLADIKQLGGAQ